MHASITSINGAPGSWRNGTGGSRPHVSNAACHDPNRFTIESDVGNPSGGSFSAPPVTLHPLHLVVVLLRRRRVANPEGHRPQRPRRDQHDHVGRPARAMQQAAQAHPRLGRPPRSSAKSSSASNRSISSRSTGVATSAGNAVPRP